MATTTTLPSLAFLCMAKIELLLDKYPPHGEWCGILIGFGFILMALCFSGGESLLWHSPRLTSPSSSFRHHRSFWLFK